MTNNKHNSKLNYLRKISTHIIPEKLENVCKGIDCIQEIIE